MLMKLMIEPIPTSCVKHTLQNRIRACAWEKLCKKVEKQQDKRCGICGKRRSKARKLIVHEEWEYTDLSRHQYLKGLLGLCHMCHLTKHIEQARLLQLRGDLDMHAIETHFCRVNAVTPDMFRTHVAEALQKLHIRNRQKHWTTDLGEYTHLVEASKEPPPEQGESAHLRHRRARPSLVKAAIHHKTKVTGSMTRKKKEIKFLSSGKQVSA